LCHEKFKHNKRTSDFVSRLRQNSIRLRFQQLKNAFNNVVFGTPGAAVNDPANFGIVGTQGNQPRLIQLALRYTF